MYLVNVNDIGKSKCKWTVENAIQNKLGIAINIDGSSKTITYVKKIIFVILLHVLAKTVII